MKLSAGILAALATTGDAQVTCAGTTELFEVSCSATTGFNIVVNEACRGSFFTMVDFANSFVWKDSTVTAMATPTGTNAADVVAGQTCVAADGTTAISMKPAASGITDSATTPAFGWASVPLSCATMTQVASNAGSNEYVKYELYWNSQFVDGSITQNMYQMGQVKFTCRIDPYQEDATGVVTITEDTAVADPSDKYVDIAAGLELKVNKADFLTASAQDESALAAVTVDADAGTPVYGQAGITYTAATSAKLGDYMELKLENAAASTVLADFAVSLTKCWASTTALAATDDTGTGGSYYADTQTSAAGEFVFWDQFCSKYPSWVGPNPVATTGLYLNEAWEGASSLHAVHFRQFGFNAEQTNYAAAGSDIYYHCFVKVCDKASKATCSTTTLTGATRTCAATAYTGPSRRRRQAAEAEAEENATEIDAPAIEVPTAECGADATVCDVTNAAADAAEAGLEAAADEATGALSDAVNDESDSVANVADAVGEAIEAAVDAAVDAMNDEVADIAETESAAAHATMGLAALTLAMLN